MNIHVLRPGLLSTVQDTGRTGFTALGVGCSGAMDSVALRLANALVGNDEDAAALEVTLLGPRLRFDADSLVALTGAGIEARVDGEPVLTWRPLILRAGSELDLGRIPVGARSYLAIAGGIDTPRVLGSRSCDLHGGIGGRLLESDDRLNLASPSRDAAAFMSRQTDDHAGSNKRLLSANWSLNPRPWFDPHARPLRVLTGSHFDRLEANSQRMLFGADFRIGTDSNRVGYRLQGTGLKLRKPLELASEGVVPGTMQLPPSGDPIVLMTEAPTCGGYPRIAQVVAIDLPRLGQQRPGASIRFERTSLERAQSGYLERERVLARLMKTIQRRLRDD